MLEFDGKDGDKVKYIAIAALFAFALKVVAFPIETFKDWWAMCRDGGSPWNRKVSPASTTLNKRFKSLLSAIWSSTYLPEARREPLKG